MSSFIPIGKILGLDYGSVRIGLALSDETQTIAFGKEVLHNQTALLNTLQKMIQTEKITQIVLGYPLNMKGEKTKQTLEVEKFEESLKEFLLKNNIEINIIRWDERLTSRMAESSIITSGMKKKKRRDKGNLDIISAALILQSYLDSK
jgi:putative Holliday junction resolvase